MDVLRAELDDSELLDRFEGAFERIERQVEALRERRARLNALLPLILDHPGEPQSDRIP